MTGKLYIHINALKNDAVVKIDENILFTDLDIKEEKELKFTKPIFIKGKAYISDKTLILLLNIDFHISMPCSLCNKSIEKELNIKNLYIIEKLTNIHSKYDFKHEIRNACFLEIPSYIQCYEKCQERDNIKKYLNVTKENFPFSNLKE